MPVYFILSKSKFSTEEKEKVTKSVTDTHCSITGAPSNYVTILFLVGYSLRKAKKAMLLGNIRTGGNRTQEIIDQLKHELLMTLANTLGLPSKSVGVKLLGVEPHWVWEGGEALPPPGEECEKVIADVNNEWNQHIKTSTKSFNN